MKTHVYFIGEPKLKKLWYLLAKFLWRFEGFKYAIEEVLDERIEAQL